MIVSELLHILLFIDMQKVKGRGKMHFKIWCRITVTNLMFPACLRSDSVLCFTFSLLLWNDGWRVGEGLADLAVCSGVGC